MSNKTIKAAKNLANTLKAKLATQGHTVPLGHALDAVSVLLGTKDWNALSAVSQQKAPALGPLTLNTFDATGRMTGHRKVALTPAQIEDIVDHAMQLIVVFQNQVDSSTANLGVHLDDLTEALEVYGVLQGAVVPDSDGTEEPLWLIFSQAEADAAIAEDSAAYWSNADGWTTIEGASLFSEDEKGSFDLPASRNGDAQWVQANTCPYCGSANCHNSCDEAQAGGFQDVAGSNVVLSSVDQFALSFANFMQTNETRITTLANELESHGEDIWEFLDDQIDDLKGHLGAKAANNATNNEDDQEEAIASAEAWVADNISNAIRESIAATLWNQGVDHGAKLIRAEFGPKQHVRVEYDLNFWGGDYSGVGNFAYIPLARIHANQGDVALAFTQQTKLPAAHIVHYTLDELYDAEGNLLEN